MELQYSILFVLILVFTKEASILSCLFFLLRTLLCIVSKENQNQRPNDRYNTIILSLQWLLRRHIITPKGYRKQAQFDNLRKIKDVS